MSIEATVSGANGEDKTMPNSQDDSPSIAVDEASNPQPAAEAAVGGLIDKAMLDKLQARTNEIAEYVRKPMMEDAKSKVSDNPLVSLFMAIGFGFLLGFLLRGVGRRD